MTKYLAVGFFFLIFLAAVFGPIPVPPSMGRGDFRAYWSAAHLLAKSENFADADKLLAVEQEQTEWEEAYVVATWNPPWLLAILLPYTLVSFERATWLWLLTNILIVFTGSILTWKTFASKENSQRLSHLAPIVGLLFLPTLVTLVMGQVNSLVFLGLAAFLFFVKREQFFIAGLCLVLTLVKPHLVYLTLPIIVLHLLWKQQDYRVLVGSFVGVISLTLVVFIFRPSFITDYTETVSQGSLLAWETPTLGGVLGYAFGWQWAKLMGIVILPLVLWAWWRYREKVNMNIWLPATLLISVITAPFGWGYDVIVLLVPLLQIFIWIVEGQYNRLEAIGWFVLLLSINLVAIYQRTFDISEVQVFWVPIALAMAYFGAYARLDKQS